jgi:sorbitol/mannitol transport system substrate-binding protein
MSTLVKSLLGACALSAISAAAFAETTLTIPTVNNGPLIEMQKLSDDFTKANPDIKLNFVILEENVIRQKITTDVATKGGQFDVVTIGPYEAPIWGKKGWLLPLTKLDDVDDFLPAIRSALSVDGKLYGAPFYGESSMVMYRTDLMEKAGLKMPDAPTWTFIKEAADKMTDKANGIYGICLRGKAGWGENMAFITATANSFGARWFDENWKPQFDSPEWKATLDFYLNILKTDGPPGAAANGFNENLALFSAGKCGMWIDATVAAGMVSNPKESKVSDKVGFALAPDNGMGKRGNWLWTWSLAIPSAASAKADAAEKFISWATSKHYAELVASQEGIGSVPPGTRKSVYANPEYAKLPFAKMTLDSINSADPSHPTVKPVPYVGVQFVAIPEFAAMGEAVGQDFSAALAGTISEDEALKKAQASTEATMKKAGYLK